jgi:hypothetical protein
LLEFSTLFLVAGLLILGGNLIFRRVPNPLPGGFLPNALKARRLGLTSLALASALPVTVIVSLITELRGALALVCFGSALLLGLLAVSRSYSARRLIAKSNGALVGREVAGTGLTTGGAAVGLCLLFAITIQANVRYRPCGGCINNLRQIDGAKEQWALEKSKTADDTPTWDDLVGTDKYIKVTPTCPANGTYTIGNMATKPICSISDHTLH